MNYLQNFNSFINEDYDLVKHKAFNASRTIGNSKLGKFLSIIDDLINLDVTASIESIRNASGYRKLAYIVTELGLLKNLMKEGEPSYNELVDYGFDIDKILQYLNSNDVIQYLQKDLKLGIRLQEIDYLIEFLERITDTKK